MLGKRYDWKAVQAYHDEGRAAITIGGKCKLITIEDIRANRNALRFWIGGVV